MRFAARDTDPPPTHALLETTGRKSNSRVNPVGNRLSDDRRTFWLVAEQGGALPNT